MSDESHVRYFRADGLRIPVRWTSPEAINYGRYSPASDVWALGVVLHELYTAATLPYGGWSNLMVATHVGLGHRLPPPMVRVSFVTLALSSSSLPPLLLLSSSSPFLFAPLLHFISLAHLTNIQSLTPLMPHARCSMSHVHSVVPS